MKLIQEVGRAFAALWHTYRPVRVSNIFDNFLCALSSIVYMPRIFVWPALFAIGRLLQSPSFIRVGVVVFALIHLALMPLLLVYFILLPFLGCRIYTHTPAARFIAEIERKMKARREGESG